MTTIISITPTRRATHDPATVEPGADDRPPIPYRAMVTLLGDALEQAQLITPPLARALTLDDRIGADPRLRRVQRLLTQLNAELNAELQALRANVHGPVMGAAEASDATDATDASAAMRR
jgi:hypothetical protein